MATTSKLFQDTNCKRFLCNETTESFIRDTHNLVNVLNLSIYKKGLYKGSASHYILLKFLEILNSEEKLSPHREL